MFSLNEDQMFCFTCKDEDGKPLPFKKDKNGRTLYPYECEKCGMRMMT